MEWESLNVGTCPACIRTKHEMNEDHPIPSRLSSKRILTGSHGVKVGESCGLRGSLGVGKAPKL
jgi:hypothetical protein